MLINAKTILCEIKGTLKPTIKSTFESMGKYSFEKMESYMIFTQEELQFILRDSGTGLYNCISFARTLFDGYMLATNDIIKRIDIKEFDDIQLGLKLNTELKIICYKERAKIYFISSKMNNEDKEIVEYTMKLNEYNINTFNPIQLSPTNNNILCSLKFEDAMDFKVCIEKFFSKDTELTFVISAEKNDPNILTITNKDLVAEEINDKTIDKVECFTMTFGKECLKANFRMAGKISCRYAHKLLLYVCGFIIKESFLEIKLHEITQALSFSNSCSGDTKIKIETIMPTINNQIIS